MNYAARLVCKASKWERISRLLADMHWPHLSHKIEYKIATVYYNFISASAPSYLANLLQLYTPSRSLRSSADSRIFRISIRRKNIKEQRAFSYIGPVIWNRLPFSVRHAQTVEFQITAKNPSLLRQFPSTVGPGLFKSHFIRVHACILWSGIWTRLELLCVYKCNVGEFWSDLGLWVYIPHPHPTRLPPFPVTSDVCCSWICCCKWLRVFA